MRLEGRITHGLVVDSKQDEPWAVCVTLGSTEIALCNAADFEVILAFGPVGTYVDMSNYYQRTEIDNMMQQKQDRLTAGKDIYINNNTIDNEHEFLSNFEIEQMWNQIMLND